GDDLRHAITNSARHPELVALEDHARSAGIEVPLSEVITDIIGAWQAWTKVLSATPHSVDTWITAQGETGWVDAWLSVSSAWGEDIENSGSSLPTRTAQWEDVAEVAGPLGGFGVTLLV
ncbi:MAG: hypothetical protein L0K10_16230, partial [Brevibacterium aurantiacum]|nr:hypothetical protein [Brevibacterium aurantiacum]